MLLDWGCRLMSASQSASPQFWSGCYGWWGVCYKILRLLFFELSWRMYRKWTIFRTKFVLKFFWGILMFHDIMFIFIIIKYFFVFFWTKKGNGLKLDENRLDEYRSWTKVNWTKTGLDEKLWTKTGWTKTGWTKTGRTYRNSTA